MHSLEISILKAIAYFDIFSYPLTSTEIVFFLDQPAEENEVCCALQHLVETNQLWQTGDFYSIQDNADFSLKRIKGNALAVKHIKRARMVAKFLSWVPYITGIAISGSLSKKCADKNSDLDFFIITKADRLWIVRILYSVLFKIAGIVRVKNWFCLNYFIAESELEIKEHNLFTAVEVSTLIPLKGEAVFRNFFLANEWVLAYQPNYKPDFVYMKDARKASVKKIAEWTMNFEYGNKLDNRLLSFFKKRFDKIKAENKFSEKGMIIGAYEANKHACKPMPQYFQPKIIALFQERFTKVKEKYSREILNKSMVF